MADKITIWNLALSAIGSRALISSPVEKGREADLCRLYYPQLVDSLLKSASWPCANAWAKLAVVAERDLSVAWTPGPVAPGWRFAYAAPADMLAPRHLISFNRFAVGNYAEQTLLYMQEEQPVLYYTRRVEREETFDTALTSALISILASKLCRPISGKDGRTEKLKEEAVETVLLAKTEFANESEAFEETLPSWVQARGIVMQPRISQYYYPSFDISVGIN